ncbi:MAG: hypothetical protein J1D88_06070 [Treponema sp.]|nr:hypothetical protein [Treponema sp.]
MQSLQNGIFSLYFQRSINEHKPDFRMKIRSSNIKKQTRIHAARFRRTKHGQNKTKYPAKMFRKKDTECAHVKNELQSADMQSSSGTEPTSALAHKNIRTCYSLNVFKNISLHLRLGHTNSVRHKSNKARISTGNAITNLGPTSFNIHSTNQTSLVNSIPQHIRLGKIFLKLACWAVTKKSLYIAGNVALIKHCSQNVCTFHCAPTFIKASSQGLILQKHGIYLFRTNQNPKLSTPLYLRQTIV